VPLPGVAASESVYVAPLVRGNTVSSPVVAELAPPVLAVARVEPSGAVARTSNESVGRTRPATLFLTSIFEVKIPKATPERAKVVIDRPMCDGVSAPTMTLS
jgi:hypothetical protein